MSLLLKSNFTVIFKLPDHCIFGAESSLVSSSKERKQKVNTKQNREQ